MEYTGNALDGNISIHVLRVEDDLALHLLRLPAQNFNPRPPCGGRQQKQRKISICIHYNTAICTDLQLKQSAYAFVCTDRDK